MKKVWSVIATIVSAIMLTLVLTACSSSSNDGIEPPSGKYDVLEKDADGKIYRRSANICMQADIDNINSLSQAAKKAASDAGATLGLESNYLSDDYGYSYLQFKVANDKVDQFAEALKKLDAEIISERNAIENVTEQYASIQAEIASLESQLEDYKAMQSQEGISDSAKIALIEKIAGTEKSLREAKDKSGAEFASGYTLYNVSISNNHSGSAWGVIIPLVLLLQLPAAAVVAIVLLAVNLGKQKRRADNLQKQLDEHSAEYHLYTKQKNGLSHARRSVFFTR